MSGFNSLRLTTWLALAATPGLLPLRAHAQQPPTPPNPITARLHQPFTMTLESLFKAGQQTYRFDAAALKRRITERKITINVTNQPFDSVLRRFLALSDPPLRFYVKGGVYIITLDKSHKTLPLPPEPAPEDVAAAEEVPSPDTAPEYAPLRARRVSIEVENVTLGEALKQALAGYDGPYIVALPDAVSSQRVTAHLDNFTLLRTLTSLFKAVNEEEAVQFDMSQELPVISPARSWSSAHKPTGPTLLRYRNVSLYTLLKTWFSLQPGISYTLDPTLRDTKMSGDLSQSSDMMLDALLKTSSTPVGYTVEDGVYKIETRPKSP